MLQSKSFFHEYWVHSYINKLHIVKLYKQTHSEKLSKIALFLDQVINGIAVPHELFRPEMAKRVTGMLEEITFPSYVSVPKSKFTLKLFVDSGLKKLLEKEPDSKSRHRYILTEILENELNSIACEVPVWSERYKIKNKITPITGHIDLLQYNPELDKLVILDYKPEGVEADKYVKTQILLYRELLCRLILGLKHEDILVGWFTNDLEYEVREI